MCVYIRGVGRRPYWFEAFFSPGWWGQAQGWLVWVPMDGLEPEVWGHDASPLGDIQQVASPLCLETDGVEVREGTGLGTLTWEPGMQGLFPLELARNSGQQCCAQFFVLSPQVPNRGFLILFLRNLLCLVVFIFLSRTFNQCHLDDASSSIILSSVPTASDLLEMVLATFCIIKHILFFLVFLLHVWREGK